MTAETALELAQHLESFKSSSHTLEDGTPLHVAAARELRRLALLEQAAPPEQWMPIESAPKDGTTVLLFGVWAGEINGPSTVPSIDIGSWLGGRSDYSGDDWWELATGDAYSCWMRAAHWQPLPPPPSAAKEQTK